LLKPKTEYMSHLPKIAIVGRPNVGKSALFNCIVKKRAAIVDEAEGVTRDRLYGLADLFGRPFEVIDTGGMLSSDPDFGEDITRQAEIAIEEADAIIQVVDGSVGPQALDMEVAKILRRTRKPMALAVNKMDSSRSDERLYAFSCLGLQPMIATSATHRYQIAELLEALLQHVPSHPVDTIEQTSPNVAIVGRPNVGKSMLLNALLGTPRCIVSEHPGTTRDSIDTELSRNGTSYTFVDTAGIRRKPKEHAVVEKFAAIRTESAIERADICLLVVDCQAGITSEEKKIARAIEEAQKGCVIALNKWDLVKHVRMEHAMKGLEHEIPFLHHCPKLFISAKTGRNVEQLFPLIDTCLSAMSQRIPTNALNKSLMAWMQKNHPTIIGGKRLRIYYMAQIDTHPPRFVLFVNNPNLMDDGYRRYVMNQLRLTYQFGGVPLLLTLRGKTGQRHRRHPGASPGGVHDRDLSGLTAALEESSYNETDGE
jgi:GTP-binding protein